MNDDVRPTAPAWSAAPAATPAGVAAPVWNARASTTGRVYRNLSLEQLRGLVLDGELGEADWALRDDQPAWHEIGVVAELADVIPVFTFRRDYGSDVAEAEEDMDMTPMIDVVFQLLLFFMLISTFQVQKAIGFPQPSDPKQSKNIPVLGQLGRTSVVVSVSAENDFELLHYDQQGNLLRRESVRREELKVRFEELGRQQRKTSVVIQADDKARHESVVAVIDAAYQANMEDIRIAQPVEFAGGKSADDATTPIAPQPGNRKVEDK